MIRFDKILCVWINFIYFYYYFKKNEQIVGKGDMKYELYMNQHKRYYYQWTIT